jgi:hypothetical protein
VKYTCKECGKEVIVENGNVKRDCACDNGIIAHMTATARGIGGMVNRKTA